MHTHTRGEGAMWTSGLDHSEARTGRVGFLFFLLLLLWDTFFILTPPVLKVLTLSETGLIKHLDAPESWTSCLESDVHFIGGLFWSSSTDSFMPTLCFFVPGGPWGLRWGVCGCVYRELSANGTLSLHKSQLRYELVQGTCMLKLPVRLIYLR